MSSQRIVSRSASWILGTLFVLALAACGQLGDETFTVSVSLEGDGAGVVTSEPAGIDTSEDGGTSAEFTAGTDVTLTATAPEGSSFTGWGGACSGTEDSCTVTVEEATDVTATFDQVQTEYTLSVTTSGDGTGVVTSEPAGIDTSVDGGASAEFTAGTDVTLTAAADGDSDFIGWTGACTGIGACEVTMDDDASVDAAFALQAGATVSTFTIVQDSDDAEEFLDDVNEFFPTGSVQTDSGDLDLGFDENSPSWQAGTVVGLRYEGVSVPKGAVITSASITFTAAEAGEGTVTYTVAGEASDDAETFVYGGAGNEANFDITDRATTTESSEWAVTELWTVGDAEVTSDLAAVVQEIVDRDGWADGNAMAFIVSSDDADATNYRVADSFEDAGTPAELSITYHVP